MATLQCGIFEEEVVSKTEEIIRDAWKAVRDERTQLAQHAGRNYDTDLFDWDNSQFFMPNFIDDQIGRWAAGIYEVCIVGIQGICYVQIVNKSTSRRRGVA